LNELSEPTPESIAQEQIKSQYDDLIQKFNQILVSSGLPEVSIVRFAITEEDGVGGIEESLPLEPEIEALAKQLDDQYQDLFSQFNQILAQHGILDASIAEVVFAIDIEVSASEPPQAVAMMAARPVELMNTAFRRRQRMCRRCDRNGCSWVPC
jgi:hypothetical protein